MKKIICEICTNEFECKSNNEEGCWCQKLPIKIIDVNLRDCVCYDCLSKMKNRE